jgi:regulator of RNase E activity RraB
VLNPETDMICLFDNCADRDLLSINVPISDKDISIHTKLAKTKKATEQESSQDNSLVSELSDSNVSSVESHGLFKRIPNNIFNFEDLIAAHEVQKFEKETNTVFQSGMKDLLENKTMSSEEGSIINDTRKIAYSEREQNIVLESEEEISEIIEDIEAESIGAVTEKSHVSINDSSFRTNSSHREIMSQLSDHYANKDTEKQIFSEEQNVFSTQCDISNRFLSLQLVSIKSKETSSDKDITYSSAVKSVSKDKSLLAVNGSYSPLMFQSSSPSDSEESRFLRSNSNKTDLKPLENTEYCSIGVQTECDMICHPASHAKIKIQHSCPSQPVMHPDTGESHSLQETIPVYKYHSRTVELPG